MLLGGKLSVDEEECDFEEGGVFCELLDGDASVLQDSLISIDVADPGGVAYGVHISWIIDSEGLSLAVFEFADIFGINEEAIFAFLDFDFDRLAGAIINQ